VQKYSHIIQMYIIHYTDYIITLYRFSHYTHYTHYTDIVIFVLGYFIPTHPVHSKAGFPSVATDARNYARKYITNATNATNVKIATSANRNRVVLFPAALVFKAYFCNQ